MKRNDDFALYHETYLDTPLSANDERTHAAKKADDLLDCPGVHLKSHALDGQFPRYYGKLTSYNAEKDAVVVLGKSAPSGGDRCVWTGTVREYREMWMVD